MESTLWYHLEDLVFDENRLVIALCTGDLERNPKYSQQFVGPIRFTKEGAANLDYWSDWALDVYGGYVHWLFLEPGDEGKAEITKAELDLSELIADLREDEEEVTQPVAAAAAPPCG